MATVRRVPEVYPTPQAAHDAAAAGDFLDIPAGSYGGLAINRLVHVVCRSAGQAVFSANPSINISSGVTGTMLLENLNLYQGCSGGSGQCANIKGNNNPNLLVIANRCNTGGFGPGIASWVFRLRCVNCQLNTTDWDYSTAGSYLEVIASRAIRPVSQWTLGLAKTGALDVSVNAAVGYGPAYGDWYAAQFKGQIYRIAGKLRLGEGVVPGLARIHLFRSNAETKIERVSFLMATPGAPDAQGYGDWSFEYLPTDYTYYVAVVPPAGHEAQMLGPYIPAQG